MAEKHKHYEFIKAFIEGGDVEYKGTTLDTAWDSWEAVTGVAFFDLKNAEFRIKPKKKKSVGYRRYLAHYQGQDVVFVAWSTYQRYIVEDIETDTDFIRWIDTEWQYEEYEE